MQHHKEVVNMTIGELAEACGTSVATVSRFCKKCNVDGFHHLKIGLAKEIVESETSQPVSNTISRDDIGQSLQNILANKIEELRQTISYIDEETLNTVLDGIRNAGIVQLVAVGQIGIRAVSGTIWERQMSFALSLKPGDVTPKQPSILF